MNLDDNFWSASSEQLKTGYRWEQETDSFVCLVCGEGFMEGEIFKLPGEERFFDARAYARLHVERRHGSMLGYLLGLDKKATGLTDVQKELIRDFASGLSDADIVRKRNAGSSSTIRHHRFTLKEKARQAKLFLAIMDLMEQGDANAPAFLPIHRTATQVDERYAITEEENASWMKLYFPEGPEGTLADVPRREKRKIAVLRHIASKFESGVRYSEKDVNERLKRIYEKDFVTLRRYLVEYGYLEREDDGSAYWLKQNNGGDQVMERKKAAAGSGKKAGAAGKQAGIEQAATVDDAVQAAERKAGPDKTTRKQLTANYQERKREMGVYEIRNNANGRVYVGGTANLDGLWNKEKFVLDMGTHLNKELQREWKQFGGQNFSFLVLETVKTGEEIRYDYKDVFTEDGRAPGDIVRQYKKQVDKLREQWLEKLQPYGEKGYH